VQVWPRWHKTTGLVGSIAGHVADLIVIHIHISFVLYTLCILCTVHTVHTSAGIMQSDYTTRCFIADDLIEICFETVLQVLNQDLIGARLGTGAGRGGVLQLCPWIRVLSTLGTS